MAILDFGLPILDCRMAGVDAAMHDCRRVVRRRIQNPKSKIHNHPLRRGISLLEVLISMFVLLFGLMGVAAIFPLGNHYAGKGEQYDRGSALADAAFADLKARGMLRPDLWMYPEAPRVTEDKASRDNVHRIILPITDNAGWFNVLQHFHSSSIGPGHAFVLDPMGIAAARDVSVVRRGIDVFPLAYCGGSYPDGVQTNGDGDAIATNTSVPAPWKSGLNPLDGTRWPIRRITLPASDPFQPDMSSAVAETIFRLRDDLANDTPEEDDRPGMQRMAMQIVGAPDKPGDIIPPAQMDIPLARQYAGSYSWMATIVPTSSNNSPAVSDALQALQPMDSSYGTFNYDVSVVVFHKREVLPSAESERSIDATLNIGGELVLHGPDNANGVTAVDSAVRDIRPGQWIALTGVHPTSGVFLFKWYRILSLDDETVRDQVDLVTGGPNQRLRRMMLEDVDWPAPLHATTGEPVYPIQNLRALIMPGVISVSGPHSMTMERN